MPDEAPSRKFSGPLQRSFLSAATLGLSVHRRKSNTRGGVEKVPDDGGSKKLFLGGVSIVRFPSPSFLTPPWRSPKFF